MSLMIDWKPEDFAAADEGIVVAPDAIAETSLFADEGLAEILDRHLDEAPTLSTMGHDSRAFEWRDGVRSGCTHLEIELVAS